MIVQKDTLLKFLRSVSISGDFANDELMLDITKNNISVLTVSNGKHVAISGVLKGIFEDIGEIALDKISNISSLISNFSSKEISITKKENKLVLESADDKIKSTFTLKNPEYVVNKITKDKFETVLGTALGNQFDISKEILSKLISYTNSVKADDITLKLKNKELIIIADNGDQSIEARFDLKNEVENASIKLNKAIVEVLRVLDGTIMGCSFKNDSPIFFQVSNEDYHINYLIASLKK